VWVQLYGRSGFPGSVQACQQFPESVWIEPAYGCAAVGCKTTIIFSTFTICSKIQCAADLEWQKGTIRKRKKLQKFASRRDDGHQHAVQVGFQISNERTKTWIVRKMVLRTGSYVTMWQNCIRPRGKVQLKSLVLTMRSDFLAGGVCKVVGYYT
jgi:hypothetical protein